MESLAVDWRWLNNQFGDQYLYEINRNTFNKVGSESLYSQLFTDRNTPESDLFKSDYCYLIIGSDSGQLIEYLLTKTLPENTVYLFIEPDGLLPLIHMRVDDKITDLPIHLCSFDQLSEQLDDCQGHLYFSRQNTALIRSFAAIDGFTADYLELAFQLENDLDKRRWDYRMLFALPLLFRRQLENLAENILPASLLNEKLSGKTAIILAAGPSLRQQLDWVKAQQHHLVIIAVSRILSTLKEWDITPDIIASVDPTLLSYDDCNKLLPDYAETSLFLHSSHIVPNLLAEWPGQSLYLGDLFPWALDEPMNNIPATGPTVTHASIQAVIAMGFSRLLLLGVDLCWDNSGHSHSKGSIEHNAGPKLGYLGHQVETYAGHMATTTNDFFEGIHMLESLAEVANDNQTEIINLSLQAVKIPGIAHSPADAITFSATDKKNPDTLFSASKVDDEFRQTYYQEIGGIINNTKQSLQQMRALCELAIDLNKALFHGDSSNHGTPISERIEQIEVILNSDFGSLPIFIKNYGLLQFTRDLSLEDPLHWSQQQVEDKSRKYYEAYIHTIDQLITVLAASSQRVGICSQESSPTQARKVIDYWQSQQIPGRGRVIFDRYPELYDALDSADQQLWKNLAKRHQKKLESEAHSKQHKFQQSLQFNFGGVQGKAWTLFCNSDASSLQNLKIQLSDQTEEIATGLYHLVSGYLHELNNEPQQALEEYQQTFGQTGEEDALRRIAIISSENQQFQDAALALKCLSQTSIVYLPLYAEILRIQGDYQNSVDALAQYLDQIHDDVLVLLKLAQLYRQADVLDGAQFICQRVLELEPSNPAAKTLLTELSELDQTS